MTEGEQTIQTTMAAEKQTVHTTMTECKQTFQVSPCSLCGEDNSDKFCINCQQELCPRCAKAHAKIQATSHHELIPMKDKRSCVENTKTPPGYCTEHTSKKLSIICNDCKCALCETCANRDHKTHMLLHTSLDADLLHRICSHKVPEFQELLQKMEEAKDGSPIKLKLYKTARDMVKSWKSHFWQIIEDDSNILLGDIEKEIETQEKLLAEIDEHIKDTVQRTDSHMTSMSNARKINDQTILLSTLHEGDTITKQANSLLKEIENTRQVYTIDEVLPNKKLLKTVEENLHSFFSTTKVTGFHNYDSMREIERKHLQEKDLRYKISNVNQSTITVYKESSNEILTVDKTSKDLKIYTVENRIYRMATLSNTKHVVLEVSPLDVHILNESFQVIHTLPKGEYEPDGVCRKSDISFIFTAKGSDLKSTQISEVLVSTDGKTTKTILMLLNGCYNWSGLISLHSDLQHLTFDTSGTSLCTVNLNTREANKRDLRADLKSHIRSFAIDKENNILICSGHFVHLISPSKYVGELRNISPQGTNTCRSIFSTDEAVWVTAGDYLYTYK